MILTNQDRNFLTIKFLESIGFEEKCSQVEEYMKRIKSLSSDLLIRNLYSDKEQEYIKNNRPFIQESYIPVDLSTIFISKNKNYPNLDFTNGKELVSGKTFIETIKVNIPKTEQIEKAVSGKKSVFEFPMNKEDSLIFREIQNLFIKFLDLAWELREIRYKYFQEWRGRRIPFCGSIRYNKYYFSGYLSETFLKPNGISTTEQLKKKFPNLYVELIKHKSGEQELPNPYENKDVILNRLKKMTTFLDDG